jgi:hypothetical protein
MTTDHDINVAADQRGRQLIAAFHNEVKGISRTKVNVRLQSINVPSGKHPTPATAGVLVTYQDYVVQVVLLITFEGENNDVDWNVCGLSVQNRISDDRLTERADLPKDWAGLTSAVEALVIHTYGSELESLENLRALAAFR